MRLGRRREEDDCSSVGGVRDGSSPRFLSIDCSFIPSCTLTPLGDQIELLWLAEFPRDRAHDMLPFAVRGELGVVATFVVPSVGRCDRAEK